MYRSTFSVSNSIMIIPSEEMCESKFVSKLHNYKILICLKTNFKMFGKIIKGFSKIYVRYSECSLSRERIIQIVPIKKLEFIKMPVNKRCPLCLSYRRTTVFLIHLVHLELFYKIVLKSFLINFMLSTTFCIILCAQGS